MKQVLLQRGKALLEEVPAPSVEPGALLVRTAFSVLSAGTERAALRAQEGSSILDRAADPAMVRKAIDLLRSEGPAALWERVRSSGETTLAPGYAASGFVQAAGDGVFEFPAGAAVACAGAGRASHAEWISVPRNLVVGVPPGVPMPEAAFATLGAIALQGVRRSGIQIGECAVVLGLGLIGSLTAQIARAAGARVIAFDVDPDRAARGRGLGLEAWDFGAREPLREVAASTGGLLADAVLVCADSGSPEVANLALRLARKKGRVVIVGDVRLDLDRALLYEKELDLLISTSYGPGRYDPAYEDKGIDYPPAYVRFTLNRNMGAFLQLLAAGRVSVAPLIDRVYPLPEAPAAYDAIAGGKGGDRPIGVLLRYGPASPGGMEDASNRGIAKEGTAVVEPGAPAGAGTSQAIDRIADPRRPVGIGVCGAGAFVTGVHLPLLKRAPGFSLRGLVTASPLKAREAARRFGAGRATTDYRELLSDDSVDLVLIGTRHHLHARQATEALRAGKHVLVEKPLCLEESEVGPLLDEARRARRLLAVGFNRRYSPLVVRAREVLARLRGPVLVQYRVNAGTLPQTHWLHDAAVGGGRIVGECCHFVDLILHLLEGAPIERIRATAVPSDGVHVVQGDTFSALFDFAGGSRAVLTYTGLGDASLPKERLEIFRGGAVLVLDDFVRLTVGGEPGGSLELRRQDKGFAGEWEAIGRALRGEPTEVITPAAIESAMRGTFALARAVRGER